jgi:hypothetical protein
MRSAVGDARAHFSQMRHSVLDSSFLIDLLNEITSGKAGPFSLPLRRHAPALFGALHAFESWKLFTHVASSVLRGHESCVRPGWTLLVPQRNFRSSRPHIRNFGCSC